MKIRNVNRGFKRGGFGEDFGEAKCISPGCVFNFHLGSIGRHYIHFFSFLA
jgi:hypothetical protein